jgi:hypothetical protein
MKVFSVLTIATVLVLALADAHAQSATTRTNSACCDREKAKCDAFCQQRQSPSPLCDIECSNYHKACISSGIFPWRLREQKDCRR